MTVLYRWQFADQRNTFSTEAEDWAEAAWRCAYVLGYELPLKSKERVMYS